MNIECLMKVILHNTWFLTTCCFETLLSHSMSVMMMATMRLIMMMVPRMMSPTNNIMVKTWDKPELAFSLLSHRSLNSNSPEI